MALNDIGTQQVEPTKNTEAEATWLMGFLHTYPNVKLRFFASTMQLVVDSNAAYLILPEARSRCSNHYCLESTHNDLNYNKSRNNSPIHTECKTIANVLCSAAEAECGGLFYNA